MTTNREQFLISHGKSSDTHLSLPEIAKIAKMPLGALEEVFSRGLGAAKTNPSSVRLVGSFKKDPNIKKYGVKMRLSPEQWAYGRVYAFVNKAPSVYYGADDDIRRKYNLK